ncbi:glyoxalase/bleomycin resistance/extradiol dioxygenase family protein [Carnobacterium maltaromaticum]|uniref:VOC family protein n=1 Tax=Carnobacterium maltaromaticum TaxID=2751 RepID=UPI000C762BF3|nr:VOC family protein [Carnobacterium maltaromaticum]PLS32634.1 glyoxalase/bleomycin resistance/extradiol dioxygenase family protein [Carnobacterium maltaromaticum]PLS32814.1 glyoxalase/bleomycin resistance/extradiol dioxygenase family protein [Carnobacterium maltaromaticum]PLS33399.1 glyoxalase/bleomycin resistance/extradiol dioxygenase family protein [Carnobacterium maltaromaticum]PLS40801.1 glyoxalase/bleomycin resistance/extradiol dioxygenase family protein [Carnobacterium maltaromaticum]P
MIESVGQVMLYVNDQKAAAEFWTQKIGFTKSTEVDNGDGTFSIEIAPKETSDTSFVLHDRKLVEKLHPELSLGTPSILFSASAKLETLYAEFQEKGITVGDLIEMPQMKVFNFADSEGNYFAVREV